MHRAIRSSTCNRSGLKHGLDCSRPSPEQSGQVAILVLRSVWKKCSIKVVGHRWYAIDRPAQEMLFPGQIRSMP
eukprot:2764306-Pyramimonas_sp.AAC.1